MKAVFDYEHVIEGFAGPEETAILNAVANEIELNNDEVVGIVTLTLPRNGVNGDTPVIYEKLLLFVLIFNP